MKKILSAALCAATFTFGLTGVAQADQTKLITLKPTTGLTEAGAFSDKFAAGADFIDDYIFANQPSYSLDEYTATGTNVTFTNVVLFSYPFGDDVPALVGTLSGTTLDATPDGVLPGELWVLEISGTALAGGGSYTGLISSTATDAPPPPVPEPAGWMLLLAGLGGVAARARRARKGA